MRNPLRMRHFKHLAILGLAIAAALSVAASQTARFAQEPAEGKNKRLSTHPELPVYPRALLERSPVETVRGKPSLGEKGAVRLNTAELHASDPFDTVVEWYQKNLGPKFTQWEKEYVVPGKYVPNWLRNFDVDVQGTIYARELENKVVIITLEPSRKSGTDIGFMELSLLPGKESPEKNRDD